MDALMRQLPTHDMSSIGGIGVLRIGGSRQYILGKLYSTKQQQHIVLVLYIGASPTFNGVFVI